MEENKIKCLHFGFYTYLRFCIGHTKYYNNYTARHKK